MFQQRPQFCQIIKIPKEAHHRQLSDFLLSSFYAPKFLKTRQILRPTFKTTHSRVVNESRTLVVLDTFRVKATTAAAWISTVTKITSTSVHL